MHELSQHYVLQRQGDETILMEYSTTTLYKYRYSLARDVWLGWGLPVNKNEQLAYKYQILISNQVITGSETIRGFNVAGLIILSMVGFL